MYKQGRRQVAMMSNWPELFKNLPYPQKVIPFKWSAIHCIEKAGIKIVRPTYNEIISKNPLRFKFPQKKIITAMCESVGIKTTVSNRPEINLSSNEIKKYYFAKNSIIVQTSRENPRFEFKNKEWETDKWESLAKIISKKYPIIQIGSLNDPKFFGALDMRGKTTIREAASLLRNAKLFFGLEGFLMHLAAAVQTRAVIIYGGWISPETSGYSENENLFTKLDCSPCGFASFCEWDRKCMNQISPEIVASCINKKYNEKK